MHSIVFSKVQTELFIGFVHFAAGLAEGSFLHHAVWKRWNITAGEVQFLGNAAVAQVELLESSQALDAAGGSARAHLVARCFGGTQGPPRAGLEPGRPGRSQRTPGAGAVAGRLGGP